MDKCNLKICVYAIAKNEGQFVDRWVDSMSEADGIYVLDTGSTDDTVERLKARGVHVETKTYNPWRFDVPRNDSMDLCPADTDVYVCTDLDEILNKGWRKTLEAAWLGYEKAHGARPTRARYDYIWGWEADGKTPARKFRYNKIHDKSYHWVYPVHEILESRPDETRPEHWMDTTGILLEHHADASKSRGSYLGLLELAVKEQPNDGRMLYYLAREYSFYKRWDECRKCCLKYLDMPEQWNIERGAAMNLLGQAAWASGNRDEAELWFRRGVDEAPEQRECEFFWAKLLAADGDFKSARDVLERMLARTARAKAPPEAYVTHLTAWNKEFYNFFGFVLWKAGAREDAREVYQVAVMKWPHDEFLKKQLESCSKALSGPAALLMKSWPPVPGSK